MNFRGELALKFSIQIANRYTVPELVRLARLAHVEGFQQIWINDNLGQRQIFVVLAAMAARVPIKVGCSVVVPYFRNPVDTADAVAALSELTDGRVLSLGIARGDPTRAGRQIEMPKPISMVRDSTLAIKSLLSGGPVHFRDYPAAAAYHRIRLDQEFRLSFAAAAPVRFYCGGNGPRIIKTAGEIMDGALIGNYFIPLLRTGRLHSLLRIAQNAADAVQPDKTLFNIGELDISIARDREQALRFARPQVVRILTSLDVMGFTHDEFRKMGIEPKLVSALKDALNSGATPEAASRLIPDDAVTACFVAGSPEECRDQLAPLIEEAERLQLGQIAFAKLGPDYDEAIPLLLHRVLAP